MWRFDFLNLLRLSIRIFDLFSQLTDISPIFVDGFGDKLFLLLIFPEKWWVGPLVFWGVFCDLVAPLMQVVDDLWGVLLNVCIVADLVVIVGLKELDLLFLESFSVGVFLLLHSGQNLCAFCLVKIVHFVVDLDETADDIIDRTDYLSYGLKQRRSGRLVGEFGRVISLQNGTNDENWNGLNVLVLITNDHIKLNQTVLDTFFQGFLNFPIHILDILKPERLRLFPSIWEQFVTVGKDLTDFFKNIIELNLDLLSVLLLFLLKLSNQVAFLLVYG